MRKQPKARKETPAIQAAREYGVDIDLLEANLRLSPYERLRRHNAALAIALMLRNGMRKRHD